MQKSRPGQPPQDEYISLQVPGESPLPAASLPSTLQESRWAVATFTRWGGWGHQTGTVVASNMKPSSQVGRGSLTCSLARSVLLAPAGPFPQLARFLSPLRLLLGRGKHVHRAILLFPLSEQGEASECVNPSRCAGRFAAGPQQNVEPAKRKRWGKCICMSWPVFFQTWAAPDWLPAARTTRGARGVRGGPPVNAQGTHPPCRISAASFLGTKVQKIPNKSPSSCHPVLGVLGGQVNEGPTRGPGGVATTPRRHQ
jgi:hypothetical protein